MARTVGSNLEAGICASCFPEQYLVTNQTALAEWFEDFANLGTTVDDVPYQSIEKVADLLGWEQPKGQSADDGQDELRVYYVDDHVVISATVGDTMQIIPRADWDEWQARCPEWEEVDEDDG
jgi:hypothetical protein